MLSLDEILKTSKNTIGRHRSEGCKSNSARAVPATRIGDPATTKLHTRSSAVLPRIPGKISTPGLQSLDFWFLRARRRDEDH
ncbi:hypothetical protein T440DRAFT_464640 [Plenodomus tracheiphilus IPT5]|uniref:Uncharacterized protein n=1 Tax=Plenodomus tracheiphilus IPT5 TaxID=1408161 RepID=A0A6A7BJ36_9PLEO|nr:hypothetical protein T440DRAFT_464640 [Plenodomus tracheiphilus IPT5]